MNHPSPTLLNPDGHRRMRDWMAVLPPAPLPRTVAPMPYEAIHHYLRRLAGANHQTVTQLSNLIHVYVHAHPGRSFRDRTRERLAAASGQPLTRIKRLYWGPDPKATDALGRPETYGHGLRPACRRCAARHGLSDPVPCKFPHHTVICRHHKLWIGPGVRNPSDQHDLSPFPELLRAQRHHERLAHRHGPAVVNAEHRHADRIWRARLGRRANWTPAQLRLLVALTPDDSWALQQPEHWFVRHEYLGTVAAAIAIYPDVIHLTDRLLDLRSHPQWGWIWNRRR